MDKGGYRTPEPSWPSLGWEGSLSLVDPYDRARRYLHAAAHGPHPAATTTMIILATTPSPKSVAETAHPSLTKACR